MVKIRGARLTIKVFDISNIKSSLISISGLDWSSYVKIRKNARNTDFQVATAAIG